MILYFYFVTAFLTLATWFWIVCREEDALYRPIQATLIVMILSLVWPISAGIFIYSAFKSLTSKK